MLWIQHANAQDFAAVTFGAETDYISTEWNPAFGADQDFSIDFSIRSDGWSSDPSVISDKDWGSGGNPGFNIALAGSGSGIDVNVGDGSNRADLESGQINDGLWHHVLVTFDRDGLMSLWIDGVEMQSTDMSEVGDITSPFDFNMGQDGTGAYSAGAICDISNVRVWNTVLSFMDISDIACGIIGTDHPLINNLIHNWTLQEAIGTTAADLVGMQDGTFQGAAAWTSGQLPNLVPSFAFIQNLSTVQFENTSVDATTFAWDFGDGNSSDAASPQHTYTATGTYQVVLSAGNACATDTVIQTIEITSLNTNLKQAINLDGTDDFIELSNDLTFGDDQDFSIELLVRSEGWSSDPSIISNKDWGSGGNPGFIIAGQGNGETWKINVGDGAARIDLDGGVINDGLWHHIALTYDHDGVKRIYQDGEMLAETNDVLGNIDTDLGLAIGQDGTFSYGAFFAGQVSEVRIWSVALDSSTLADNICEATAEHPNANALLHYWRVDEGSGNLVSDSQGDNNGTYNGEWNTTLFTINCGNAIPGADFSAVATGMSYLNTEWIPTFAPDADFSIDFRIRTDGWESDPSILSNKDWGSGGNPGFNIALASNGKGIDVNIGDGSDRADLASGDIADGEWHHVLATFDRDADVSLVIDGVLVESADMTAVDSTITDFTFKIGQDGTGNYPASTPADLAFVRIWNRVVDFGEIEACGDFDDSFAAYEDLVHFWKMDEGAGNPADSKGGQDASWVGEETWTFFNNYPEVQASFETDILRSNVTFSNTSTAGSYFWDFGDGNTSSAASPTNLYFSTGSFDVTLIVLGACSSDTLVQTVQIDELDQNLLTSLDLDGADDFATFSNDLDFGATGDFTIELFVRSTGWNSDPSIISNKDWGSGGNPGFIIAGKGDGETWKINVGDGTNRIDLDGGVINDDLWHHIAFSYDQDGVKAIYQDGELLSETMDVLGDINTDLNLAIGQDGTLNYGAFFDGQVAEVRIWSSAFDADILAQYQCGADEGHPLIADLVHYWKCDEGEGEVINDMAGENIGSYNGNWIISSNSIRACQVFEPVNDIGSGNSISFTPNDASFIDLSGNEGVKVTAESLNMPDSTLTLECWVKPHSYTIWHSMVSFIQDNGSFEKGWDLETNDGGLFSFALSTTGEEEGLIYLSTRNSFDEDKWYHVAGVFDGTEQRIYVNGILENARPTDGPAIDYADAWFALGMYKDDNENFTLDGDLDEVRVWSIARSEDEIRADMCQKLTGSEDGLYAYYRLDNLSGTQVRDYGPNNFTGEMIEMNPVDARILSGAALGDESIQVYAEDMSTVILDMETEDKGSISLSSFQGNNLAGAHLYRVNQLPNTINGVFDLGDNDVYYGTFLADPSNRSSHDLSYDYSNYPNAVANETSLSLYNRADNGIQTWLGAGSVRNLDSDRVEIATIASRREILLGDFSAPSCIAPVDITLDDVTFTEATLSWSSNGDNYNIQYGLSGFPFGMGMFDTTASSDTFYTIAELEARTNYDFYVQANCGDSTASAWVGPFTFMTQDPCGEPSNIETKDVTSSSATITFDRVETVSNHDLQWGTANFTLGTGITTTTDVDSFLLEFLPPDTDLEYYVRSNCDEFGLVGDWIGPFKFRTLLATNTDDLKENVQFSVFPNPASDVLNIQIISQLNLTNANISLINPMGQVVYVRGGINGNVLAHSIDVSSIVSGIYYMKLVAENQSIAKAISIQK